MPFSRTSSATEEEWTEIFETFLKPAVEGAGLDYECRRSVATRGNVVGLITQDLNDAYVVLADLTDRNANVFYELGVRHALTNRTILLAQRREDIPFDLQGYANHIYNWRTEGGRESFAARLRELLAEIDTNPTRPDNPVSDFLGRTFQPPVESAPVIAPAEASVAQPLAGPAAQGLNAPAFVQTLERRGRSNDATLVLRLTRAELLPRLQQALQALNERQAPAQVNPNQISQVTEDYLGELLPLTKQIEEFLLASVEEGWTPGVRVIGLGLAGLLISLTKRGAPWSNRIVRGAPEFIAWRLLVLAGAKSLDQGNFEALRHILLDPIEVEEQNARFTQRSFLRRRDAFWPEAFLGYADLPINYIARAWNLLPHIQPFFNREDDFQLALGQFLIVSALAHAGGETEDLLYPGYRLLPGARRAMSLFSSRMRSSDEYFREISGSIGVSPEDLRTSWSQRAERANAASLGSRYLLSRSVLFPETLAGEGEEG